MLNIIDITKLIYPQHKSISAIGSRKNSELTVYKEVLLKRISRYNFILWMSKIRENMFYTYEWICVVGLDA